MDIYQPFGCSRHQGDDPRPYMAYICVYTTIYVYSIYLLIICVYNIYIGNGTVSFSFMSISPSFTRQHYSTPRVPALLASLPRRRSSDEGAIGPWAMGLEISCFGGCIHVPSHQSGQIITTSLRPSPVESWLIREIIPKWP
jgi:hypothetical protein